MVTPLQGSQAAPWLTWSLESSLEPSEAWYQGWAGKLCRSKDGTLNMLVLGHAEEVKQPLDLRVLKAAKNERLWAGLEAVPQPMRASCVAPGLLLGWESSLEAGVIF